ncbi:protein ALP1-like [Miscanthus floridulus]|uniref:protein ALP1-like n=1 Tax=Miscanthus floridulus TaxID=154761 RepID=UPI00345916E7
MTTPPPLLLTAHSAAALLVLLGPTARTRKRLRRDEAGSASDAEATDPDPDPTPAPAQATPAAAPERETPPPAPAPLPLPPTSLDDYPLAFRVSAPTFHFLSGLLDPLLSHPSLPSPVLLALALARLASGLPYPALAALFRVPPSAPRAASRRLRRVLLANFRFWLAFPSDPTSAYSAPLPSCRGALCCARFAGPTGPLAAQLVAGASSRVLSLAAGFRGDRTDLEVLRLSSLYQEIEQGKLLDSQQYLVGDGGGYPLLPWLMVPFPGPVVPGSPEAEFNAAHRAMCRPVRRAIRSLMGWGAIARLREEESSRAAVACIGTCAMLHNVLLTREDYSALAPDVEEAESDLGEMHSQRDDAGAGAEGLEVDGQCIGVADRIGSNNEGPASA